MKKMKRMKKVNSEVKLCFTCMEEHEVSIVKIVDSGSFKNEYVDFEAEYEYCRNLDEYTETEDMMRKNSLSQKDAYREKMGLLTSKDIKEIREQYGISQKEFSEVLCWGGATITRYENHQVQDRAHDDILRKIKADPKWFVEMLQRAKDRIGVKAYTNYYSKASELLKKRSNPYTTGTVSYTFEDIFQSETIGEINTGMRFDSDHKYADVYKNIPVSVTNTMADPA